MEQQSKVTKFAWKLYRSAFKDGEDVVLEDNLGRYVWGNLTKTADDGILLTRPNGKSRFLYWHEIVFMAHDGFPVAEIMGMTSDEAGELAKKKSTNIIRESLENIKTSQTKSDENKNELSYYVPPFAGRTRYADRFRTFGGGCPFVFGPCYVEDIFFYGNNGPKFWGEDDEETLVLRSKDGAVCHSFDMSHLFLFDGLKL